MGRDHAVSEPTDVRIGHRDGGLDQRDEPWGDATAAGTGIEPMTTAPPTERRVVDCYTVFDSFFPAADLLDYTEGIYGDDPATPYDRAKQAQFDYLLDEIHCGPGVRVLEVGCGNGNLLEQVRLRGGTAVGITITPAQVERCRARGLDARLIDLFSPEVEMLGRFDAIVANGPIEHFVQPAQAARGEADVIYRRMFEVFDRLLDPASPIARVVNTTLHFARAPAPEALMRPPLLHRPMSDAFHYSLLARSFGGFYPVDGQLEAAARGRFQVERAVDGTRDYMHTSGEWLRRMHRAVRGPTLFRIFARSLPSLASTPLQYATMVLCMFVTRSWNWQFQGEQPPVRLWRQTWRRATP